MALDLETLNGQISSMRGSVKQVKTHLINKLTREAKKLREKKGTEEQKKQNQKKADRFIEEVMLMKKILPDDVSKFVLKTENCESVISKPNIPLETKVLARFGTHKILVSVIDKFRSEHPTWKEVMEDLVQKVVSRPKQTISAQNTSVKCSVVRTPGNNIFSVTPVKHIASDNSHHNQSPKNKQSTPISTKAKKSVLTDQVNPKFKESGKGKIPSKMSSVDSSLKPANLPNSSGKETSKRKSFMDSSSDEDLESGNSDEFDRETFQKAFKRQKSEDESEDSEESGEEEESSEDSMGENGGGVAEDSDEGNSDEESYEEESDSDNENGSIGGQSLKNPLKGNKTGATKISGLSSTFSKKDESKDSATLLEKTTKSKLNEELDDVERRLKKGKMSKSNSNNKDSIEESVDPFFITTDGKEYISSAPAPKTEEKPYPSNFPQNNSAPKEIYRKGKKITPSHAPHRNFNDGNNRGRFGSYQNRNNDRNNQRDFGDNGDRRDAFFKNDRKSFNKNNRGNFSHNNRGNFSNVNDRRNSFNNNNKYENFDGSRKGNFSNYNDRRNSFNKNDGRSFNGNNRGKPYNYNDRKSGPGSNFNSKDRFNSQKQGPKFDSNRQSSGNSDHLHPSWEAKKKMSTLAPFQGIKTVFND
ncbi:unnamed protein product [Bemisia tabaci]|uniref:Serum response factor-binding protein 1 n=1 Tax=Bemisia tabaci TaxID=7038 RepID=A0A9P0A0K4_BEMTA|nr:unnamed protein product [Bemisia tabaci]